MTIEIGILLAVISAIVGLSTFYIGRKAGAKKDGEEWGELKTDIRYIKSDVKDIKESLVVDMKASIRRLHKRIDDHEEKFHGRIITRNEDDEV